MENVDVILFCGVSRHNKCQQLPKHQFYRFLYKDGNKSSRAYLNALEVAAKKKDKSFIKCLLKRAYKNAQPVSKARLRSLLSIATNAGTRNEITKALNAQ